MMICWFDVVNNLYDFSRLLGFARSPTSGEVGEKLFIVHSLAYLPLSASSSVCCDGYRCFRRRLKIFCCVLCGFSLSSGRIGWERRRKHRTVDYCLRFGQRFSPNCLMLFDNGESPGNPRDKGGKKGFRALTHNRALLKLHFVNNK